MKNIKLVFSILSFLLVSTTIQAQKGTDAQRKAVENTMNLSKSKVDAASIPARYSFSWKYSMEMKTEAGKSIVFDYFLEPNASYYGVNMNQTGSNMFMIMDFNKKLMVTSFEQKGKKTAMASQMPDYTASGDKNSKYTYKKLPNKVFNGLSCKGIQATNATSIMVFYYTSEAKVSFEEMFKSQKNEGMANAFKSFFKSGEKPLMMSMDYKDLKDKSKSMKMKCLSLEKKAFTFNKADYQFM